MILRICQKLRDNNGKRKKDLEASIYVNGLEFYANHVVRYVICINSSIDLLFDKVTSQNIVEIKSGKTVQPDFFKNLKRFKNLNPTTSGSWVVYGGDQMQPRSDATVLTWKDLASMA